MYFKMRFVHFKLLLRKAYIYAVEAVFYYMFIFSFMYIYTININMLQVFSWNRRLSELQDKCVRWHHCSLSKTPQLVSQPVAARPRNCWWGWRRWRGDSSNRHGWKSDSYGAAHKRSSHRWKVKKKEPAISA